MNGIFAIDKPKGLSSSTAIQKLKEIFNKSDVFAGDIAAAKKLTLHNLTVGTKMSQQRIQSKVNRLGVKIGHGGTLDPLARGVLIVGVGAGTKQLNHYLGECTKTYETWAVLGQSTTTGDSEGAVTVQTETGHVTLDSIRHAAEKFVGKISQTPPVYSALKVDGKPLYEYAREGIPIPRDIKARNVVVHEMTVHDDFGPRPEYGALPVDTAEDSVGQALFRNPTLNDHDLCYSEEYMASDVHSEDDKRTDVAPKLLDPTHPTTEELPVFHATMSVSSGTYIRSLVSDIGRAARTSAYMAELIRTKQGEWELNKNVFAMSDFTSRSEVIWGLALLKVLAKGPSVDLQAELANAEAAEAEKEAEKVDGVEKSATGPEEEDSSDKEDHKRRKIDAAESQ